MPWSAALALTAALLAAAGQPPKPDPPKPDPKATPKKAAGQPPKADPGKDTGEAAATVRDEFQRLQGTWQVEGWAEGGAEAADAKTRGVFVGGNIFVFRRDGKTHQAGVLQLDPGKGPRTFNATVREGAGRDGVLLGIYRFAADADGLTLTLCYDPAGQARPADFNPDPAGGFVLVKLRKPKPPADEAVEIAGKYRSELVEATGKTVVTEAVVERRGDSYLVTYTQDGRTLFVGTALRKGSQLSMCWVSAGQVGVSVYLIEKGPKLVGEYTALAGIGVTGKETLTPWKRID